MNQKKIGDFISKLRKEKNLTQEQLGQKLGVSNKTISRWENGNYLPDISLFEPISQEFNISINELLKGERIEKDEELKESHKNILNILNKNKVEKKKIKIFIGIICLLLIFALIIVLYQSYTLQNIKEDTETHLVFKNDLYINEKEVELTRNEYLILHFLDKTDSQIKKMTSEEKELLLNYYYGILESINWYGFIGEFTSYKKNNLFDNNIKIISLSKKSLPFTTAIFEEDLDIPYCLLGYSKYGTIILSEYTDNKCQINNLECSRLKQDDSKSLIDLNKYCPCD